MPFTLMIQHPKLTDIIYKCVYLTTFYICTPLFSCNSKTSLTDTLVSATFWDYYSAYDKRILGCYEIKKSGECNYYNYYYHRSKDGKKVIGKEKQTTEHLQPADSSWSVQGDSILVLQGRKWWVASFNKDTILIKTAANASTTIPLINFRVNDILNKGYSSGY